MGPLAPIAPLELHAGPDLILRTLQPRDAPAMFQLIQASRGRLRRWLAFIDATRSPADAAAFVRGAILQARSGVGHHFALRVAGALAGVIGYRQPDAYPTLQIGYWLGEGYEGRGLMTAACRTLVSHAFAAGAHRVEIRAATGNDRSRAVAERLGFRLEGVLREAESLPGPGWVDHCVYGMTVGDWGRLRGMRPAARRPAPAGSAAPPPGGRRTARDAVEPPVPGTEAALDAELAAYYQARAAEYDDWYERRGRYADGEPPAPWFHQLAELQAVAAGFASRLPPRAAVLDAGCGTGRWTAALAERTDLSVVGLDLAPAMLQQAQERLAALGLRATAVLGDARALPFAEAAFDGALAGFLFDHLAPEGRAAFLAELRRVVRPGGRVLFLESRRELRHAADVEVQHRVLRDGRAFAVRKGVFTAATLAEAVAPLGESHVGETSDFFTWAEVELAPG